MVSSAGVIFIKGLDKGSGAYDGILWRNVEECMFL